MLVFPSVNDVKASMETRIRDNDIIAHRVHRHEPPVAAGEINVVFEDDNLIVVNKPSSIPVNIGMFSGLPAVNL